MSKKQPALITRYKVAVADLSQATALVAELEKKLKDATSTKDLYYRQMNDAQKEVEQVQTLLDVLPHTPPRRQEGGYTDTALMTRLAGYLAHRSAA